MRRPPSPSPAAVEVARADHAPRVRCSSCRLAAWTSTRTRRRDCVAGRGMGCAGRKTFSVLSAIDSGQAVQFPHRPSRTEPYTVRTVEPWGVMTEKAAGISSGTTAIAAPPARSGCPGSAAR